MAGTLKAKPSLDRLKQTLLSIVAGHFPHNLSPLGGFGGEATEGKPLHPWRKTNKVIGVHATAGRGKEPEGT